jgi:hypothetical protein
MSRCTGVRDLDFAATVGRWPMPVGHATALEAAQLCLLDLLTAARWITVGHQLVGWQTKAKERLDCHTIYLGPILSVRNQPGAEIAKPQGGSAATLLFTLAPAARSQVHIASIKTPVMSLAR